MPLRAVFDANILISGLVFRGIPGRCLDAAEHKRIECIICPEIMADVIDKLATKFHHDEDLLADEAAWLVQHTQLAEPEGKLHGVCRDPDDDAIIECALISGAACIVTGDKDLLSLERYESVELITPAEFLTRLASARG